MHASIYDVAQRSGVSIATVSRVLNHSGNVREQTVEKVRKAMQELHYSENLLAKGLAAQRSSFVGVLIPGELAGNSTYVIECLSGIGQVLEAAGYHVLLLYESMGGAEACERYLREHLIAGVLTLSASSAPELVERLAQNADCAVGYIGSPKENFACNVYANYPGYASELVERLQKAGKDKILLFCDQPFNMKDLQRCLCGKGIGMEKIEWHCRGKLPSTRWREEIAEAVAQAASAGSAAVFTDSVSEAASVLAVCRSRGFAVPEQVYPITVEHSAQEGRLFVPGIDTYLVPAREMGEQLAEMVLRRMQGVCQEERLLIQGKYHPCESIGEDPIQPETEQFNFL